MDQSILTDENVDDIIETAQYGGITYWCVEVPAHEREMAFAANPDAAMVFRAEDYDDEDSTFVVTKEDIRKAYFALLDLGQKHVNREIHGYFIDSWRDRDENGPDMGHIDADAADCIVQIAAFGEVVYG